MTPDAVQIAPPAKTIEQRAADGESDAQYALGTKYLKGDGVRSNAAQALAWFSKAAAQGNADAEHQLGCMYCYVDGIPKDEMLAFEWFRKAAEHGHIAAHSEMGFAYMKGKGVALDYAKAFECLGKSAARECPFGAFYIGQMWQQGLGREKDEIQAFDWYMISAQLGFDSAQATCGLMYMRGIGVGQNDAQGLKWYSKAAEQGHFGGYLGLGGMSYHGRCVDQNLAKAAHLYCEAGIARCPKAERGKTLQYPREGYGKQLLPHILLELNRRPAITKFVLADQAIDDQGAKAISAMIENNRTLSCLDISGNDISPIGAAAILSALQNNTTLITCNVNGNPGFKVGDQLSIQRIIQRNLHILQLNAKYIRVQRDLTSTLEIPPEVGQLILQDLILTHQRMVDLDTNPPMFPGHEATERLLLELACVITHAEAARTHTNGVVQ